MNPPEQTLNRPWIAVNMLMTADGKISGPGGGPTPSAPRRSMSPMSAFGSPRDHARLLDIRASMDAVMCGRGTIESGPIDLGPGGVRYEKKRKAAGLEIRNRRIIVSGSGALNASCKVFATDLAPTLIATTQSNKRHVEALLQEKPWIQVRSFGRTTLNLRQLVAWLHGNWGIERMVLEGGGKLNDAMFQENLVDEVFLTVAPLVFGGDTHSTISDGKGFAQLKQAASFECVEHQRSGGEMFLRFRKHPSTRTTGG